MKNNLEWYRHKVESHNHKKFKMLRIMYAKAFDTDGWAGEGKFWALNNMIADSDHCELDCSSPMNKLSTAAELGFTVEDFDRYIQILTDCNLIQEDKGCLFTDDVQDCLAATQEKRQQASERQKKRRAALDQNRKSRKHTDTSHVTNQMSHEFVDDSHRTNQQSSSNSKSNSNSKNSNSTNEFVGEEEKVSTPKAQQPEQPEQPDAPPPARKKRAVKPPEESTPHWKKLMEIFNTMHQMSDKNKLVWRPADYQNLKRIADTLQKITEEEGKEWTLQVCAVTFNEFLSKATMIPFLKGKFTPPKIYSQFNEILAWQPSPKRQPVERNGVFTECLANYRNFYVKQKNIEPSIRPHDEDALDKIIGHLEKITKGENPDVAASFGVILERWDVLPPFLKDRMDISDMYFNLNKIIDHIKNPTKNGHTTGSNGFHKRREAEYVTDFTTAYHNLDPRLDQLR